MYKHCTKLCGEKKSLSSRSIIFGGASRKVFIYLCKVLAQWPRGHGSQRQRGALLAQNDKLRAGRFFGKDGPIPDCIPEPTGELKKKAKFPQLGCFLEIRFRITESNVLIVLKK